MLGNALALTLDRCSHLRRPGPEYAAALGKLQTAIGTEGFQLVIGAHGSGFQLGQILFEAVTLTARYPVTSFDNLT